MRTASALVLAAMLFVSAGCQPAPAPTAQETAFRATATVRELMQSVVAPSAQGLWDSVGTISTASGTFNLEPRTDAEWAAVRQHAVALVESTNLLLIPGRHVAAPESQALKADEAEPGTELGPAEIEKRVRANWPDWTAMAHALHDSAMTVLATIDRKDAQGLMTTGSDLDAVCETCHLTFWYPPRQGPPAPPK